MAFPGFLVRNARFLTNVSQVVNLTASTTRATHTRKVLVATLEQALRLDADAVAVHVNISSAFESEMLQILGLTARECDSAGMPLLAIMYPRREKGTRDDNYSRLRQMQRRDYGALVAHATRVGVDLGADVIKTQYTGDIESFRTVVRAGEGRPILVAGGPRVSGKHALRMARAALDAGAAGLSFGRNVFDRPKPAQFLVALRALVHERATVARAESLWRQKDKE
jgi:DhnA family fructose-bisphosphate aldolase class Ia